MTAKGAQVVNPTRHYLSVKIGSPVLPPPSECILYICVAWRRSQDQFCYQKSARFSALFRCTFKKCRELGTFWSKIKVNPVISWKGQNPFHGTFPLIFGTLLHRIFPSNYRHFTTLRFLSSYGTKQTRMNEALFSILRQATKHKAKACTIGAAVKVAFRAFDPLPRLNTETFE